MTVVLPVCLTAQDVATAMLRSDGNGVFVNGSPAPASIALYDSDLVETQKNTAARIETTGSAADLGAETVLQFQADQLVLDHGSVSVFTTRGLRVRVGCVTVTPVNPAVDTVYEVLDREGKVAVHATKSDVYIDVQSKNLKDVSKQNRSNRDVVHETEQKTREEKCAGGSPRSEKPAGIDAIMNSRLAVGLGAAGVIAGACLGLCRDDDPLSPYKP